MASVNAIKSFLAMIIVLGTLVSTSTVSADQWFDSYGKVSGNDELARFSNLAFFLQDHPETVGYIAFCTSKTESNADVFRQKTRGVNFVVSRFHLRRSRFKIINYGPCAKTRTILQPIDKTKQVPSFF